MTASSSVASLTEAGKPRFLPPRDFSVVDGLLLISYPLHPPGKPESLRTAHFPDMQVPAFFAHGTKDAFGSLDEMRGRLAADSCFAPAIRGLTAADTGLSSAALSRKLSALWPRRFSALSRDLLIGVELRIRSRCCGRSARVGFSAALTQSGRRSRLPAR